MPDLLLCAGKSVARAIGIDSRGSVGPLTHVVREATLWVCGAIALIMLVALLSYSPQDPGFSHTGDGGPVQNRIGGVGAWYADVVYSLFGAPALLFPALFLVAGWVFFAARRHTGPIDQQVLYTRLTGFALTLASSCGLATLHFSARSLPQSAGGAFGELLGTGLAGGLGGLGATLLLLALWLAGISLFTGLSWIAVMDRTGKFVLDGIDRARQLIQEFRARADSRRVQEERQEVVRKERKKTEKKSPPRIEPVLAPPPGVRAEKERQVPLFADAPVVPGQLPALSLLDEPPERPPGYSKESLEAISRLVEMKLRDFGVEVEVVAVQPGPVVTRFELAPAAGVKVSQISNLSKDLARSLSAISVRVVEVIPGKPTVGLEIPNESREMVTLGEILRSRAYEDMASPLTLALGKDIGGKSVVADLQRMPHLLIAGTTGSGKSVGINAMVLSLLYKSTPEDVRMIMIDPKMLELSVYEGIPHLLAPVVTDMKESANALRWCVAEMERRYRLMAALGVRNLGGYNRKVKQALDKGEPIPDPLVGTEFAPKPLLDGAVPTLSTLPHIVVIIDELADMMMIVGKKVEELIARLAQKARASGIHMVIATQRPSVDVITGLIKANIPTRIAFQVSAKVDSRTILDQSGAESLLGHGDMLFLPPGTGMPLRVHGAFVSDQEVHRVVAQLKGSGPPEYLDEITEGPAMGLPGVPGDTPAGGGDVEGEDDPLYDQAVQIVCETRRASVSGIQRRLKIGYNRAARLVETMESAGLVGPLQSNGFREVLAPPPPDSKD